MYTIAAYAGTNTGLAKKQKEGNSALAWWSKLEEWSRLMQVGDAAGDMDF